MQPKCSCGGHFVEPSELGFDSDGSILVCDSFKGLFKKTACTNYILSSEAKELAKAQWKAITAKQFRTIKAVMFASHFLAVVPFFFGAPLWEVVLFAPLVYWDFVIFKEWFAKRKVSVGGIDKK
jgi:hypothetical protein